MPYCPNCSSSIESNATKCGNCAAVFGPGSAWKPTQQPLATREPERDTSAFWKPKTWIAVLLGLLACPLAFLYVARPVWAAIYVGAALLVGLALMVFLHGTQTSSGVIQVGFVLVATWQAFHLAKNYSATLPQPWYSRWYGLVAVGALLALVVGGRSAFLFEAFRIPSGAMSPSIPTGAHVIAAKWGYGNYRAFGVSLARTELSAPLKREDVVVFEYPEDRSLDYVKRVIGLPGDRVQYRRKQLTVNGRDVPTRQIENYWAGRTLLSQFVETLGDTEYRVLEDTSAPAFVPAGKNFTFKGKCSISMIGIDCEVPPGHLFVLGDHRDESSDSRHWGFVPFQNIVGKVAYIFP